MKRAKLMLFAALSCGWMLLLPQAASAHNYPDAGTNPNTAAAGMLTFEASAMLTSPAENDTFITGATVSVSPGASYLYVMVDAAMGGGTITIDWHEHLDFDSTQLGNGEGANSSMVSLGAMNHWDHYWGGGPRTTSPADGGHNAGAEAWIHLTASPITSHAYASHYHHVTVGP